MAYEYSMHPPEFKRMYTVVHLPVHLDMADYGESNIIEYRQGLHLLGFVGVRT